MTQTLVPYTVIHCSSEELSSSTQELGRPFTSDGIGWSCARNATFPQELVVRLSQPTRLTQLQLLSHEFKIASKVEICVSPDSTHPAWRSLGFLSFSTNERSRFAAREMKSVTLPSPMTSLIRIVFLGVHVNERNAQKQVGLLRLHVRGQPLAPPEEAPPQESLTERVEKQHRGIVPPALTTTPDPSSERWAGGLAPEGYAPSQVSSQVAHLSSPAEHRAIRPSIALPSPRRVDRATPSVLGTPSGKGGSDLDDVTAARVVELERLKAEAVSIEDYDEAKRLKAAIARLRALGGKIAALEARKAAAVAEEDYDAAKEIKAQIESLRRGSIQLGSPNSRTVSESQNVRRSLDDEPGLQQQAMLQPPSQKLEEIVPESCSPHRPASPPVPAVLAARRASEEPDQNMAPTEKAEEDHLATVSSPQGGSARGSVAGLRASLAVAAWQLDNEEKESVAHAGDLSGGGGHLASEPPQKRTQVESGWGAHPSSAQRKASSNGNSATHVDPRQQGQGGTHGRASSRNGGDSSRKNNDTTTGAGNESSANPLGPMPPGFPASLPAPEPLSAETSKDAADVEEVLGPYLTACCFARAWQLREAALQFLLKAGQQQAGPEVNGIENTTTDDVRAISTALSDSRHFVVMTRLISTLLRDRVAAVFQAALPCLLFLAEHNTVPKSRMSTGLSEAIAILVDKAGDLNTRLADAATEMLLQLVRLGVTSSSLGSPLLAPFKPGTAARSALGRMRLVEAVLPELGVAINSSGNGLACERLAAFLAPAFTHAAGEVRTAAVGLAIQVGNVGGLPAQGRVLPADLHPKLRDAVLAGSKTAGSGGQTDERYVPRRQSSVKSEYRGAGQSSSGGKRTSAPSQPCSHNGKAERHRRSTPVSSRDTHTAVSPSSGNKPRPTGMLSPEQREPLSSAVVTRVEDRATDDGGRTWTPAIPQNWRTETSFSSGEYPTDRHKSVDNESPGQRLIGTAVYEAEPERHKTTGSSYSGAATSAPHPSALDDDASLFAAELAAREARYGPHHAEVADALSNLAIVYNQRGDVDAALPLYRRALQIWERALGPDHLDVAQTLTDIAVIHLEKGEDAVGRPLLAKALEIQEAQLGSEHPDVVAIRDVLEETSI